VAILGVLFLYVDLHSMRFVVREVPTVEIADITPAMNFAQVYLEGKATFVRYDEETRFLGMFLTDENSDIFVRAYDSETRRLIEMEKRRLAENDPQPKFPAVGDDLRVRGNLRIRPDFEMMILQFAEGLSIERPEAIRVKIENIVENKTAFEEHQRLEIEGKVVEIEDRDWAVFLTVYELETGAGILVLIPEVVFMFGESEIGSASLEVKMGERLLRVNVGAEVRVRGAFSVYHEQPQLWMASWDDLGVIG
jgi:hypothetical protein